MQLFTNQHNFIYQKTPDLKKNCQNLETCDNSFFLKEWNYVLNVRKYKL
jgi:hypothetical protein